MSVKTVTLSGELFTPEKQPITNKPVDVYRLTNLFQTQVVDRLTTDPEGKYELTYQLNGIKDSLVLVVPNNSADEPLFKKFILINEDNPHVSIPSPPMQQKKRRTTRGRERTPSSNFDALAQKTLGTDWESTLIKQFHTTTELIQDSYRETQIPLDEQEELNFLFNTSFWNAPTSNKAGDRFVFFTSAEGTQKHDNKELPEAIINLKLKKDHYSIESVAIRYKDEKWVQCKPEDSNYQRYLYLANCTAITMGLTSKLICWGMVLPSLYAQAFISTISKNHPLRYLLGAHLTEDLLINQHMGMPFRKPLLELAKCSGLSEEESWKLIRENLKTSPFEMGHVPSLKKKKNLPASIAHYRARVIIPVVSDFFEYYREALSSNSYKDNPTNYWLEIHHLATTFAELHPLDASDESSWWMPFAQNPYKPEPGEIQKLKDWCADALLVTTLMPYVTAESLNYLTDLRFATLNSTNRAIKKPDALEAPEQESKTPEDIFEPHGGTSPENASMQLSRVHLFLQEQGKPLDQVSKKYDTFQKHLNEAAEVLRAWGMNPTELFTLQKNTL